MGAGHLGTVRRTDDRTAPATRDTPLVRRRDRIVGGGPRHRALRNNVRVGTLLDPAIAARLRRNADGLVAAIVREHGTGDVLMMAWMDDEALHRTLTTGLATYWSRSRKEYWVKGATSGHYQHVKAVALDCDGDALLVTVEQEGAACHTGTHSCFTDELLRAGE
jgi:phosphoribosyl-AMP cyclohydrolase